MHLLLIIAFFLCILTGVVFVGVWYNTRNESVGVSFNQSVPSERETAKEIFQETVTRVGQAIPKEAKKTSRMEKQLDYAGYHQPNALNFFNGTKATSACVFALFAVISDFLLEGSVEAAVGSPSSISPGMLLGTWLVPA